MRRESHKSLTPTLALSLLLAAAAGGDGLRGNTPVDGTPKPPLIAPINDDDKRRVRNYPEQPPVIPHDIRGYQVDLRFNKCLDCHSREAAPKAGAPMVGVTHFMDRDFQVLTEVSPRRYFCTQCHVPQSEAEPLVGNRFGDE